VAWSDEDMVPPQTREGWLSEQRKVPAVNPEAEDRDRAGRAAGDRSVRGVCREYQIAETSYCQWHERLLGGGKQALANPRERTPEQDASPPTPSAASTRADPSPAPASPRRGTATAVLLDAEVTSQSDGAVNRWVIVR
jgi:hypothetical protein